MMEQEQGRWIDVVAEKAGNFEIRHGLGRVPEHAHLEVTKLGLLCWQPKMWDDENLYFQASAAGMTGRVRVS